jgi:K+-transporting ATPase ATPase C chain
VRYGPKAAKPNDLVGGDVEGWFHKDRFAGKPGIVAQWAERHLNLAEDWVKATGDAVKERWGKETTAESFVAQWRQDFPSLYEAWRRDEPRADVSSTTELAAGFFRMFSAAHPGRFPYLGDGEVKGAPKRKKLYAVKAAREVDDDQNEVQKVFFDMWRQEHLDVDLLEVPGDMVTASASGLDPHITLKNAEYQARWRVADAWVDKIVKDGKLQAGEARRKEIWAKAHDRIVNFVKDRAAPPLGGLAGVPLVNVVEVNVALPGEMEKLAATLR